MLDCETFSKADLKKVGTYNYARHPSTEVLCFAWRCAPRGELKDAKTFYWSPVGETAPLSDLVELLIDPSVRLVAHNAFFERNIVAHTLARQLPLNRQDLANLPAHRWECTASLAAALSLPRSLDGATSALNLAVKKDKEGHRLMLKWCKPRKPSKHNPAVRHTDRAEYQRLIEYCVADVDAETLLYLTCPPLLPSERRVWLIDQEINDHGYMIDRPLVQRVLGMIEDETQNIKRSTRELTGGAVDSPLQVASMLDWLASEDVTLPNLKKDTVALALTSGLADDVAKVMLEYRQALSKTSTKKYSAFELMSDEVDQRVRGGLLYHGAGTGRWTGAGVQPHNFPRGLLKDPIFAAECIAKHGLEDLRLMYGQPMDVFSSCLRSMIRAPEGYVLDVCDYSAIEARVVFWLAGHQAGIQAFEDGRPIYEEQAARIFGKPVHLVTPDERFLGKQSILGCSYQMGAPKFQLACAGFGRDIPLELAERCVAIYREANAPVTRLWKELEKAAHAAVNNPGRPFRYGHLTYTSTGNFLWCRLPSGRRIAYCAPYIRDKKMPWGMKPTLFYKGVNSVTRRWEDQGTYGGKLAENASQAVARDIMADAIVRIHDTRHWRLVLSVHDELIAERSVFAPVGLEDFRRLMTVRPVWAKTCPIAAEGWSGTRYKK